MDGGVHAGTAAGRDPVSRVADEEGAPVAVPVGDLGREREAAHPQDAYRQIRYPGTGPDQLDQLAAGRQEYLHPRPLQHVQHVSAVPDHLVQRRPEQHSEEVTEVARR